VISAEPEVAPNLDAPVVQMADPTAVAGSSVVPVPVLVAADPILALGAVSVPRTADPRLQVVRVVVAAT
jgi:hypothetical protein